MKILREKLMLCQSCMEEHEVKIITINETNIFKDTPIEYSALYYYCERTGDFYCDEEMMTNNDIAMKNSYRRTKGLLTSDEIIGIRNKYGITQRDLCKLLGWGEKTITRYEGHQVQDFAHDSILRKLADDPAWFLSLLENPQLSLFVADKTRYKKKAELFLGEKYPVYRGQALRARRIRNSRTNIGV